MIDEKKLLKKLECCRWKMASDTTPIQALQVKFGNEMLDMVLDEIKREFTMKSDSDCISRAEIINLIESKLTDGHLQMGEDIPLIDAAELLDDVSGMQPQVQPIARSLDEVAEEITKTNLCSDCKEVCIGNCSAKSFEKAKWIDWLTGKSEV